MNNPILHDNQIDPPPFVVIRCMTYNHESYIREALEGFVSQKTNFPFVAIVHDDASTDRTAAIVREYAEKYPDIIKPIFETENQYSKKDGSLGRIMTKACEETGAKYVAMCEGDDYWTDSYKLQKQVDFLETHPDIVYTCHRYEEQKGREIEKVLAPNFYLDRSSESNGFEFDLQYAFNCDWVTKTLTAVYRMECLKDRVLTQCKLYRDTHLVYDILQKGNGYCFSFVGGVYRRQETGIWSQGTAVGNALTDVKKWWEIYSVLPIKFNLWKYRNFYASYVKESIKSRRLFRIGNRHELQAFLYLPLTVCQHSNIRVKEYKRIGNLGCNK